MEKTSLRLGAALIAWVLLASGTPSMAASESSTPGVVVVLLFDGLSPGLVEATSTPGLDRIRREGAWSHQVEMAFPTDSLVNQISISTGCWPRRHGIVGNLFVDPERGRYDHDHDADWLLSCEHLHQAAERQGARAASLWWVGAGSRSSGPQASFTAPPSSDATDIDRAALALELLARPAEERPRLILVYLLGPDQAAHFKGVDAAETRAAVEAADRIVSSFLDAAKNPDAPPLTLLVTTDHGMRPVKTVVNLRRILGKHDVDARSVSTGATAYLYFDNETALGRAQRLLERYEEFEVFRRESLPAAWRLGNSRRLGDLMVVAKPPYFIEDPEVWPWYARWLGRWGPEFIDSRFALRAGHGYPPDTPQMDGLFYAWGHGIRKGIQLDRLKAVDIHPTAARILAIEPGRPTEGRALEEMFEPFLESAGASGGGSVS